MFTGAVLTETIFAWPGMGGLIYQALLQRDYALLMGLFFMVSVSVILMSLVTDVLYTLVDPRIRCFYGIAYLFLVLIVVAIFGGSIWKLIALIGITNWPPVARLVRAEFLSLREREFILAARTVGVGHFTIMLRHILPNALPVVIPTISLRTAGAIITQASLTFLGASPSGRR